MAFTSTPLVLTSVSPAISRGAPQWMTAACTGTTPNARADTSSAERMPRHTREIREGWFFKGTEGYAGARKGSRLDLQFSTFGYKGTSCHMLNKGFFLRWRNGSHGLLTRRRPKRLVPGAASVFGMLTFTESVTPLSVMVKVAASTEPELVGTMISVQVTRSFEY